MWRILVLGFAVVQMPFGHPAFAESASGQGKASSNPFASNYRYHSEHPDLRWVNQGTRLMVGGNWILDPKSGRFTDLPYATAFGFPDGGTLLFGVALSPLGERVAVWGKEVFSFGPVLSPLQEVFPLPRLAPDDPNENGGLETQRSVLFWSGEQQLVLYQMLDTSDVVVRCQLFDTATRAWQPIVHCPEGDFYRIDHIDSGPQGLIAIYSSGEGVPGMTIARYHPLTGHQHLHHPSIDLYPMGWAEVGFHPNGELTNIMTPCSLNRSTRPCADADEATSLRLYSWYPGSSRFVLRHAGLPPHSVPSPEGDILAWSLKDRVCLAPIRKLDKKTCHCLPSSSQTCRVAQ